jgi:transposase InsO family protein
VTSPTSRPGKAGSIYQVRGIRARKTLSAEGRPHLRGFPRNTDSADCDEGAFHRIATVIDFASRRVVGFALAHHLRTELVSDALANAVAARDPAPGGDLPFRPGQYTSAAYATLADDCRVTLSVGRKGQCWDNAVAESFFASLKGELIDTRA